MSKQEIELRKLLPEEFIKFLKDNSILMRYVRNSLKVRSPFSDIRHQGVEGLDKLHHLMKEEHFSNYIGSSPYVPYRNWKHFLMMGMFSWDYTPEGFTYWMDFCIMWNKYYITYLEENGI